MDPARATFLILQGGAEQLHLTDGLIRLLPAGGPTSEKANQE